MPSPGAGLPECPKMSGMTATLSSESIASALAVRARQKSRALFQGGRQPHGRLERRVSESDRSYATLRHEAIHCCKHVAIAPILEGSRPHAGVSVSRRKSRDKPSSPASICQKLRKQVHLE